MLALTAIPAFERALAVLRTLLSRFESIALDRPTARSLRVRPLLRIVGVANLTRTEAAFGICAAPLWLPALLVIAALPLFDDQAHMPTRGRLAVHLAAAGVAVWTDLRWARHLRLNPGLR